MATSKAIVKRQKQKANKKKEISIHARNASKFARSLAQRIHCAYWAIHSFSIKMVCELDAKHPPIATYLFILGLRDRTECIQKSQTWLPSCRDEYHEVIAELSRGVHFSGFHTPPVELMRCCSSIQGLISQVFKKKRTMRVQARSTRFTPKFLQFRPSGRHQHLY